MLSQSSSSEQPTQVDRDVVQELLYGFKERRAVYDFQALSEQGEDSIIPTT